MKEADKTNFEARLKSASDAKKALLEKFKPRPAAVAPEGRSRAAQRALELSQVRAARVTAKSGVAAAAIALLQTVLRLGTSPLVRAGWSMYARRRA